jgi:large subunit ribosomal protein L25
MATQSAQIKVSQRSALGSRANKRLRETGLVPGVIYGHKEAIIPVSLPKKEVVQHLSHGAHLFDLNLDGKPQKVLVKEVQYDHLGIEVIHVDFARVSLDEKVKVTVSIELKGTPKGEADGGVLQQPLKEVEIECLVTDIPDMIRHTVAEMALNDVMHVKDLPLPAGVKILGDPERIVAAVREVQEEVAPEPVEGAAEPEVIGRKPAEGEGEEGAAPAAGGEAPKKEKDKEG